MKYPNIGLLQNAMLHLQSSPELYISDSLVYTGRPEVDGKRACITQATDGHFETDICDRELKQTFERFVPFEAIRHLVQKIRYRRRHPGDVVLWGTFFGNEVSSSLLSNLPQSFCITDICVGGDWVSYQDVHDESARIFNISQFGYERVQASVHDLSASKPSFDDYTNIVCSNCPVSEYFGMTAKGCGTVWKCDTYPSPSLWFKCSCGLADLDDDESSMEGSVAVEAPIGSIRPRLTRDDLTSKDGDSGLD